MIKIWSVTDEIFLWTKVTRANVAQTKIWSITAQDGPRTLPFKFDQNLVRTYVPRTQTNITVTVGT